MGLVCWTLFISLAISGYVVVTAQSSIDEGTYYISYGDRGEKSWLVATPPTDGDELGEVFAQGFQTSPSSRWRVKLSSGKWLHSLTPEANAQNTVTINDENERGSVRNFQLVQVRGTKYRIEEIVGRRSPRCLKFNGRRNPVTFEGCRPVVNGAENVAILWEFDKAV